MIGLTLFDISMDAINGYSFLRVLYRFHWVSHIFFIHLPHLLCMILYSFRASSCYADFHSCTVLYALLFITLEVCTWVNRFQTSDFFQICSHLQHFYLRLYPFYCRTYLRLTPLRNACR